MTEAYSSTVRRRRSLWQKLRTRPRRAWIQLKVILGFDARHVTPDRLVLEQRILPHYGRDASIDSVLFVGCAWYTSHYWKYFPAKRVWTIDSDSRKRKYSTRFYGHVVDSLECVDRHFDRGFFDLIVCNGVYGWGLNRPDDCERAFRACLSCLAPGGRLVVGWNETPDRNPAPFDSLEVWGEFDRLEPSPLGPSRFRVGPPDLHVFDFFVKPPQGRL